jgi:hypothetical protein
MAFKSAGALAYQDSSKSVLTYQIPSGVVPSDTVLLAFAWGNSTAGSVTLGVNTNRTNRYLNPRAVSTGAAGWTSVRTFGTGGAGTYGYTTGQTGPGGTNITTTWRKTWTTASSASFNAGFQIHADANNYVACTPGETISISAWVRHTSTTQKTLVSRVQFYNQAATAGATTVGALTAGATSVVAAPGGAWYQVTQTVLVPAGANGVQLFMDTANVGDAGYAVGEVMEVTGLLVETGDVVAAWFDGAVTGDATVTYAWTGTANASTSTKAILSANSTGVVVPSRNDTNMGWTVLSVTGVQATQLVTLTHSLSVNKIAQAFVFDAPVGMVGAVGNRGGVSQAFTTAPALSGPPVGTKILMLSLERTTGVTALNGVSVPTGETVTQLSYVERTSDPDVSFYLGRCTSNPTGAPTITYSAAAGNGAAVLLAEVVVTAVVPAATATFTGLSTGRDFALSVVVPGQPAAFKAASPLVKSVSTSSLVVPNGTLATDYVYALLAWGQPQIRSITASSRPTATVVAPRIDNNMGWLLVAMTGAVAGETITLTIDGTGQQVGKLYAFDRALSPAGPVGTRNSTVNYTVAPSVPVDNSPSYVFAVERTLTDATLVTNAINSIGSVVTQVAYEESPDDPDISLYLGRVAAPVGSVSGATTLTYDSSALNGAAVTIPTVSAPLAIAPTFGSTGKFTLVPTPPTGLVRVYLGRPASTGIRVKAVTSGVASVRLAASLAAGMTSPVFSSAVVPDAQGYAALSVGGLTADTDYYWQIELAGVLSGPINKTRTFPTEGAIYPRLGLLIGSCTKGFGLTGGGNATNPDTFAKMLARTDGDGRPARLFIDLGDDIYPCTPGSPNGNVFPENANQIRGWWESQHQQSQRSAFHAKIPTAHVWSDNDYVGNNSDSTVNPTVAALVTAVRRQVLSDGPFGSTDNQGLYWSALLGRVLLVMTDSRSYSSNVLLPNSTVGKTMLGDTQKAWLYSQFARTDYGAVLWFHDNQWVGAPGISTSRPGIDNWQAFATERAEIAQYLVANKVNLLMYVHGDNHTMGFDDGTNNAYGGFPFALVAPIYQDAQPATFPTTGATWPTSNLGNQKYYTWLELTDDGTTITATVTGWDATSGPEVARYTGTVSRPAGSTKPDDYLRHEFYENVRLEDIKPQPGGGGGGDQGPQGPQGPPGPEGPVGPTGVAGPAGATGATGAQGVAGPQGPKGDTGTQGIQGVQGPAGSTGPQGPSGVMDPILSGSLNNTAFTQINGAYTVDFGPIVLPRAAKLVRITSLIHVQTQSSAAFDYNIGWENGDVVSERVYTNISGGAFVHDTFAKMAWVTDPAQLGAGSHRLYVSLVAQSGGPTQVYNSQCSWEAFG